jgi:stearoyl-CoA desaturase (delta-9 desaturase)
MHFNRKLIEGQLAVASCVLLPLYTIYWFVHHLNATDLLIFWAVNFFLGIHVTTFMHRAWTHLAWKPTRALNIWGLLVYTLGFSSATIGWAAVHRKHHRFSDTEQDPHSPFHMSKWRILFLPYTKIDLDYSKDLLRDPDHLRFYKYYWHLQLVWFATLYLVDPELLWGWIAVLGFHGFKMRLVNVIGHNGNRTHSNSPVLAYLYMHGEPWHGNHHEDPKNWRFGKKWYQIDLGAVLIRIFVALGIAKARL